MKFNYNKLRGRIVEKYGTLSNFSEAIGISFVALSKKMNNLIAISQKDMDKAFVEIVDDVVSVTDYYFGVKKEKTFSMCEIETAEILIGYSIRVRGYRYSNAGCTYIVFRGNGGKYMFKVICVPETKQFFSKYLN